LASSEEIQKRIDLLYKEASVQKSLYEADNRRTTALKASQSAVSNILELEKKLASETVGQNKAIRDSQSLQESISDELDKQKGLFHDIFGIESKSKMAIKEAAKLTEAAVADNGDLAGLGNEQLKNLNKINKGQMSSKALSSMQAKLEKEIAEDTEEGADARNDIRKNTLGAVKAQKGMNGLLGKAQKSLGNAGKSAASMVTSFLSAGAAVGFLVASIKKANEISGSVGKEFGALGMNATGFSDRVNETVPNMMRIGLNASDLNSSITQLTSEFGININQIDAAGNGIEHMAMKIADSGKAMGLNTQEATKLYGTFMKITDMTQQQAENMLEQTASLAMQSGVAPQVVMRDIANSGEIFASHMRDGGKNVLEAAIRARQLGLSLDKISKIGDSMMNFQSSLNAEMEASVMIGRQLNLQKARELYLSGDLVGFQDEILKQLGSEEDFNKMNILQKQSLAKAMSMTVEELQKTISGEEEMQELAAEIEETNPFKDLIGEDTMTAIDKMLADFNALSAQLGITLLPIMEGLSNILTVIEEKFGIANVAAGLLALKFTMMIGPALAAAASYIATAMGASAAMMPVVGWVIAAAAGYTMFGKIKSMMAEAKSMKDGVIGPGGQTIVSGPKGSIKLNDQDSMVVGTNLGGGSSTTATAVSSRFAHEKRMREQERFEQITVEFAKKQEDRDNRMISIMDSQNRYLRDLVI